MAAARKKLRHQFSEVVRIELEDNPTLYDHIAKASTLPDGLNTYLKEILANRLGPPWDEEDTDKLRGSFFQSLADICANNAAPPQAATAYTSYMMSRGKRCKKNKKQERELSNSNPKSELNAATEVSASKAPSTPRDPSNTPENPDDAVTSASPSPPNYTVDILRRELQENPSLCHYIATAVTSPEELNNYIRGTYATLSSSQKSFEQLRTIFFQQLGTICHGGNNITVSPDVLEAYSSFKLSRSRSRNIRRKSNIEKYRTEEKPVLNSTTPELTTTSQPSSSLSLVMPPVQTHLDLDFVHTQDLTLNYSQDPGDENMTPGTNTTRSSPASGSNAATPPNVKNTSVESPHDLLLSLAPPKNPPPSIPAPILPSGSNIPNITTTVELELPSHNIPTPNLALEVRETLHLSSRSPLKETSDELNTPQSYNQDSMDLWLSVENTMSWHARESSISTSITKPKRRRSRSRSTSPRGISSTSPIPASSSSQFNSKKKSKRQKTQVGAGTSNQSVTGSVALRSKSYDEDCTCTDNGGPECSFCGILRQTERFCGIVGRIATQIVR